MDHFWRREFARSAKRREQDRVLREQLVRELDEAQQESRVADGEFTETLLGFVLATHVEIAAFRIRLDRYDEATVTALMRNEEEMVEVERILEDMRKRAYVLPDGRRVFKTKDGLQVFDEQGTQVSEEEINPVLIGHDRPTWEALSSEVKKRDRLLQERTDILSFQERVDAARERLDDKGLTKNELDDLGADLEQAMPKAVRRELPGYVERPDPALKGQFDAAAGSIPASVVAPIRAFDQLAPQ